MQKQVTQTLALLAIILIIWFVIPLISFNHIQLLPSVIDKLFFIGVLLISWLAFLVTSSHFTLYSFLRAFNKIKFWGLKKRVENQQIFSQKSYAEADLILTKHFQLVKELCRKKNKKKKYPVYLLVGNKYAGKTSLLTKSGQSFKTVPIIQPTEKFQQSYQESSDTQEIQSCLWNIHENCLFIDTPGDYANSEINENVLTPWRSLINLLLRKYQTFPIKALVLTISIHDLISNSPQNNKLHLHLLKQRIIDLKKHYGEISPLYIIFTKWDMIPGFAEFFDTLSADERQQVFSIKFNKNLSEETAVSQFKQQYELVLQQMGRLVISKMHQEHNSKKRALISQFPLQMEQLQKVLIHVVKQLMEKTYAIDAALPIAIYFTSSEQENETVDILFQKMQSSLNLNDKQLMSKKQNLSKSFFIHDIFQEFVNCQKPSTPDMTISRKTQYTIYTVAAIAVFSFALFTLLKFSNSLKTINGIEASELTMENGTAKNSTKTNISLALAQQLNNASSFWLGKKIFLSENQNKAFNSNLTILDVKNSNLIPSTHIITTTTPIASNPIINPATNLQNYLETILTDSKTPPATLYNTLKAYLMLAEPSHLQYVWLTHWLDRNAVKHKIISGTNMQQFITSMQQNKPLFIPKAAIVNQVQNQLTTLPGQYLVFLMLQSEAKYSGTKAVSITIANKTITIPFLFTAQGLQTIFLNNLKQYVNTAVNGNWVLGKITTNISAESIQQQLITMYITNYVSWWSKVFYGIKISKFTNIQNLANYVAQLANPHNGIINAYNIILENTNPDVLLPQPVSDPTLIAIRNNLSQQLNANLSNLILLNLTDVQNALSQFNQFLNTLSMNDNIPESAFLVIKRQFENPTQPNILTGFGTFATTLPDPLNTDFSNLAQQSQQLTEQAGLEYLQNIWQTQVLSFYNQYLDHRYPLYFNSLDDISLDAFTKFFAPDGILQNFYVNYLSMFINSNSSVWQWQTTDGLSLPLSNDLLLALEKARIITTMFFPNNTATPSVNFSLQQEEVMPVVQSFSLEIDGQSLNDPQGTKNVSSFLWPGNSGEAGTKILFLDINGQRAETERQGVWSWFRILDISTINADGNSEEYNITFDVDGNEARYHLSANNPINPFIPGIINTFRIPSSVAN